MRSASTILFLFLIGNSFAQTKPHSASELEAMERQVPKKQGKEKALLLADLAEFYSEGNPDKALGFGERAVNIATAEGDEKVLAKACTNYSMPFMVKGNYEKSNELNFKALDLYKSFHDTLGIITSYSNLGHGFYGLSKYKQAQKYYNIGIKLAKIVHDDKDLAKLYGESAVILEVTGFVEESLKLQYEVIDMAHRTKNKTLEMDTYGNIAICYLNMRKFDKSRETFNKVITLANQINRQDRLPLCYQALGVLERRSGNLDMGLSYYQKAFRMYHKGHFDMDEGIVAINIGNCFVDLNNLDSAAYYINYGLKLVEKTKSYKYILNAYRSLTDVEIMRKNYQKAVEYSQLQNKYQDTVNQQQGDELLTETLAKYEVEKNEKKLLKSEARNAKNQLYQAIWLGVSVALFLLLLVIFLFFRHKRKLAREELIRTKQEEQFLREKQLNEQKLSISRELHDNIGSQITYLISSIDNMSYIDEKNLVLSNQLRELSDFGRNTMQELRSTIWAMNAEDGNIELLLTRIEGLRSKIPLKLEINNTLPANYPLKSTELLNIFRIIQETLQNTLKYAQAKSIAISFSKTENGIQLEITDDGIGMDPESNAATEGNGLRNMRYRCEQMGGMFELDSKTGAGTTIRCKLSHIAY